MTYRRTGPSIPKKSDKPFEGENPKTSHLLAATDRRPQWPRVIHRRPRIQPRLSPRSSDRRPAPRRTW